MMIVTAFGFGFIINKLVGEFKRKIGPVYSVALTQLEKTLIDKLEDNL
jgi:hypothetical protein